MISNKLKITFIQTGGTIDKDYPKKTKGWGFEISEPAVKRILEKLDPSFNFELLTAFKKDSQEIIEEDRRSLALMVNESANNKFIITHGTDTLIETARYLSIHIENKLVILTGAMLPERFSNSDAEINLGCAIGACSILSEGVYIAMHGIIKSVSGIRRDLSTGKFF